MPPVRLLEITKRFGQTLALDQVSLTLQPGCIHGLLGENGAGKTTLMNVLYGLLPADSGQIQIGQANVSIRSPRQALDLGIGMVHQHFALAGAMTVLDNILLGDQRQGRIVNRRKAAESVDALSNWLGLTVDPMAIVNGLSVGQQQRVEILKALYRDVELLILDEPTAVLTAPQIDQLLAALDHLSKQGKTVVFISHKLAEVRRICDRVTILRRGKVAWEGDTASATADELARHMVGRPITPPRRDDAPPPPPQCHLRLQGVCAPGLHDVDLDLSGGIMGIAGVDGNGQQPLAQLLLGLMRPGTGRILLNDTDITAMSVANRQRLGVAMIPEDRKGQGLVGGMSITQNMALRHYRQRPFSVCGIMHWNRARQLAGDLAERFDVRAPSVDAMLAGLSGGNQQKVLLARELAVTPPKLLIAVNPTRGLDIAATIRVHEQLLAHRAAGGTMVLISSELEELAALSDHIAVLYRGRLYPTDFPRQDMAAIVPMLAGVGIPTTG